MHTKIFVIEMPDSIDIQPETIVYALSYISNHDFVVTEASQQRVQPTKARCICVDFINCNPDPVPNPDCAIHGAGFCA
jgi:hypothetical protein